MNRRNAQLWGGPHDGLNKPVQVLPLTGPPETLDVPVTASQVPNVLGPLNMAPGPYVRYRLDADHEADHLLYRLERQVLA